MYTKQRNAPFCVKQPVVFRANDTSPFRRRLVAPVNEPITNQVITDYSSFFILILCFVVVTGPLENVERNLRISTL
jgi:hypothetical protein